MGSVSLGVNLCPALTPVPGSNPGRVSVRDRVSSGPVPNLKDRFRVRSAGRWRHLPCTLPPLHRLHRPTAATASSATPPPRGTAAAAAAASTVRARRFLFTGRHVLAKCGTPVAKRQRAKTRVVNKMDKGGALTGGGTDSSKKSSGPLAKSGLVRY